MVPNLLSVVEAASGLEQGAVVAVKNIKPTETQEVVTAGGLRSENTARCLFSPSAAPR